MNDKYLLTIPDTVKMTRTYFANVMTKFKHHRNIKIGFSTKHTEDIMAYRKETGNNGSTLPSNLYNLPVEWNVTQTYIR